MALSENYRQIIEGAIKAIEARKFYAQYPEHPKAYPEDATQKAESYFKGLLNKKFEELQQGNPAEWIGEEVSPYTSDALGITYPAFDVDTLVENADNAFQSWKKVSVEDRAEVLVEALEKIKERFFDIAFATMHSTGQSFMMSFQASGPHSNDRALEAMALAYQELTRYPSQVEWEKPMGKFSVKLEKSFKPIPKGVALAIGCSTFPVWNSVPGIFASLMTGNSVIVKPHPGAVLPIAIVVAEIQNALKEKGLNTLTVQLAVDKKEVPNTIELAEHPKVKLIDYTGGNTFGDYVESLPGKTVFTEKAGVNSVILDSTNDLKDTLGNLSFSVSLYSGQMCTAPQNFFVPESGVKTPDGNVSFDEVVEGFKKAVSGLANHPKMGAGTLGAIQNENTLNRVKSAKQLGGELVLEPAKAENAEFSNARVCAPGIIKVNADQLNIYEKELFGPLVVFVKTKNTDQSIELAKNMAERKGAITC
ncbi:MAG: aldehyde dehydrogenase family protein, partial [Chitinophagales bacterium]